MRFLQRLGLPFLLAACTNLSGASSSDDFSIARRNVTGYEAFITWDNHSLFLMVDKTSGCTCTRFDRFQRVNVF